MLFGFWGGNEIKRVLPSLSIFLKIDMKNEFWQSKLSPFKIISPFIIIFLYETSTMRCFLRTYSWKEQTTFLLVISSCKYVKSEQSIMEMTWINLFIPSSLIHSKIIQNQNPSNSISIWKMKWKETKSSCVIATHISSVDFLIIDHIRFFIVGGAYILVYVLVRRERERERKRMKIEEEWEKWKSL